MIQLLSRTGMVTISHSDLLLASKVFANMDESECENSTNIVEWALHDFTQTCLEQFVEFTQLFPSEIKLPTQVTSENFVDHVPSNPMADFILVKTNEQLIELLLLANYIESTLLFQLCCLRLGCFMIIPQHAIASQLFGISLEVPSNTVIEKHTNS